MPLNKHKSSEMHAYGYGRTIIAFSFFPNGASQPVSTSFRGTKPGISSITRSAAGTYAIVFDDNIIDTDFISMIATAQSNALADAICEFGPYVAATKTLTLRVSTSTTGAALDMAANANSRVSVMLVMALRGDNK